jgi:hypothetical protein
MKRIEALVALAIALRLGAAHDGRDEAALDRHRHRDVRAGKAQDAVLGPHRVGGRHLP